MCVKRIESGPCVSLKEACASGHACINGECKRTSPPEVTCTSNAAVCEPTSTCEQEKPECTSNCYKTCILNCAQDAECGFEKFCIKGKCRESLELKVTPSDGCEALVADPLLGAF